MLTDATDDVPEVPRARTYWRHVRAEGADVRVKWTLLFAGATALLATGFGLVFSKAIGVHAATLEVTAAIFIAGVGIAVVPVTLLLVPRLGEAADPAADPRLCLHRVRELLPIAVALLSAAAAVIHFAAIYQQGAGYWLFYVLFAGLSIFQLAWTILIFVWPSRLLYVVGALANMATVAVWADSRTVGFPIGPTAHQAETVAFGDLTATILEVLLVLGVIAILAGPSLRSPRGAAAAVASFLMTLALLAPTALAMISSAGTHLLVPPSD